MQLQNMLPDIRRETDLIEQVDIGIDISRKNFWRHHCLLFVTLFKVCVIIHLWLALAIVYT